MKKIIFLLDNMQNPQIPKEGDVFSKKHHSYFAPLIRNQPLNLPSTQVIKKVFRLDIASNFYIAITDEAYLIYPAKRYDRNIFDKKIYFAIVDNIPTSISFKELTVYYINDRAPEAIVNRKVQHKITFPEGIGLLHENIYIAEGLRSTTIFFVNSS